MTTSYLPTCDPERLFLHFGVTLGETVAAGDAVPGSPAPVIRRVNSTSTLERQLCLGMLGLVPPWAREVPPEHRPASARDSIDEHATLHAAWRMGRRCVVPADAVYEQRWEEGRAVRWRIRRRDGRPMGIAGVWDEWIDPAGFEVVAFAMLTVKARNHPVFRPICTIPGELPRMVAILKEDGYDAWLEGPLLTGRAVLNRDPSAPLVAEPAPR